MEIIGDRADGRVGVMLAGGEAGVDDPLADGTLVVPNDAATEIGHAIGGWAGLDHRSAAVLDGDSATEVCREQHRGGAASLVLGHSVPCGEDSGPDGPGLLIDPGPELVGVLVGVGWLGHGVDCGGICHVVEAPEGCGCYRCADPHLVIAGPGRHRSGRWIQLRRRAAEVAAEEPSCADKWVSREGQLGGRGEDPQLAGVRVVDVDGFGEAELGGEWLSTLGWYRG